ncbi:hypothetical protein TCAL_16937 [Tigriopus californicus]|uniref:Uncharacterized protein n=1 Tax=Tigriopus californicus TaxID=6832 RepID=A0A553NPB1_TIGCA|nr:hypothetical protein TCAL_16937 [Tigriopus californicus]
MLLQSVSSDPNSSLSSTVSGSFLPLVSGINELKRAAKQALMPKTAIGKYGLTVLSCSTKGATIPPARANTEQHPTPVFRAVVAEYASRDDSGTCAANSRSKEEKDQWETSPSSQQTDHGHKNGWNLNGAKEGKGQERILANAIGVQRQPVIGCQKSERLSKPDRKTFQTGACGGGLFLLMRDEGALRPNGLLFAPASQGGNAKRVMDKMVKMIQGIVNL